MRCRAFEVLRHNGIEKIAAALALEDEERALVEVRVEQRVDPPFVNPMCRRNECGALVDRGNPRACGVDRIGRLAVKPQSEIDIATRARDLRQSEQRTGAEAVEVVLARGVEGGRVLRLRSRDIAGLEFLAAGLELLHRRSE